MCERDNETICVDLVHYKPAVVPGAAGRRVLMDQTFRLSEDLGAVRISAIPA